MSTNLPTTLYTATGVFQAGSDWRVEVYVPNFPTREDADAYAAAFRVTLVDGKLFRDDGKGVDVFDDTWRDVLDTQAALVRVNTPAGEGERVNLPIAQWESEPGFNSDFQPIAWNTVRETL